MDRGSSISAASQLYDNLLYSTDVRLEREVREGAGILLEISYSTVNQLMLKGLGSKPM